MKRSKHSTLLLPFVLLITLLVVSYSCDSKDDEEICSEAEKCDENFSFCSLDDSYYYLYGTQKYYCNTPFESVEASCNEALASLVEDMCKTDASASAAKIKAELIVKSQKMMDEILSSISL